jgi:hypothetical protein
MPATIGVLERKRNKLELGSVIVTPKASTALAEAGQSPDEFLARHECGDWGEVGYAENELSLCKGYRVCSIYPLLSGEKIWIITQPDRTATTVLLPEEY